MNEKYVDLIKTTSKYIGKYGNKKVGVAIIDTGVIYIRIFHMQ